MICCAQRSSASNEEGQGSPLLVVSHTLTPRAKPLNLACLIDCFLPSVRPVVPCHRICAANPTCDKGIMKQ